MSERKYTPLEFAIAFVNGLTPVQRDAMKEMIEHGNFDGAAVAKQYGVPRDKFLEAVKSLL